MKSQQLVFSRDRRWRGRTTGTTQPCPEEGCPGERVGVRWADGARTWPCSRGLVLVVHGRTGYALKII